MEIDRNGLEVLSRDECLRLLGAAVLGRLAVSTAALPTIVPVTYRYDGRRIVLRTGRGTKLDAATRNAVVAFEIDDVDPATHAGWSVVVTGVASEVTEPADLGELARLPLERWAPGEDDRVIAISTDLVSGRRIVSDRSLAP